MPFLGCYHNNPIGSLRTIQSSSGSPFQYGYCLNIIRIQIGNTITRITIAGVAVTTHYSNGLCIGRVQHRHTIYHIQWLIITIFISRTDTTDRNFSRTSQTGRVALDSHTGDFSFQRIYHILVFHAGQVFTPDLLNRISQRGSFLLDTHSSNYYLLQSHCFFFHLNIESRLPVDRDAL